MHIEITNTRNGAHLKSKNSRIEIVKPIINKDKIEFSKDNVLVFKALTKDVGKAIIKSKLTCNKKVKTTVVGLTDKAVFELYYVLQEYLKEVKFHKLPQNKTV